MINVFSIDQEYQSIMMFNYYQKLKDHIISQSFIKLEQ